MLRIEIRTHSSPNYLKRKFLFSFFSVTSEKHLFMEYGFVTNALCTSYPFLPTARVGTVLLLNDIFTWDVDLAQQ